MSEACRRFATSGDAIETLVFFFPQASHWEWRLGLQVNRLESKHISAPEGVEAGLAEAASGELSNAEVQSEPLPPTLGCRSVRGI